MRKLFYAAALFTCVCAGVTFVSCDENDIEEIKQELNIGDSGSDSTAVSPADSTATSGQGGDDSTAVEPVIPTDSTSTGGQGGGDSTAVEFETYVGDSTSTRGV